jgi:hypothetical protein
MADEAYSSRSFRGWLRSRGIKPTIPHYEPLPRFLAMMPFGGSRASVASVAHRTWPQWGAAGIILA